MNKTMAKITKVVGEKNIAKAKQALNKEAKKASDKIGDAVHKKVKKIDSDKVEKELNKYIDKYIK
jgi:hypothetical protein